ncbi:MAG TPA: hypothetical protein VLY23_12910 [Candidatus Acidoferrum sp.]|nr:hypothetical protein [Candidatus Acidoferrum sp.]
MYSDESGKLPRVDWTETVEHVDHAVKVAGAVYVTDVGVLLVSVPSPMRAQVTPWELFVVAGLPLG